MPFNNAIGAPNLLSGLGGLGGLNLSSLGLGGLGGLGGAPAPSTDISSTMSQITQIMEQMQGMGAVPDLASLTSLPSLPLPSSTPSAPVVSSQPDLAALASTLTGAAPITSAPPPLNLAGIDLTKIDLSKLDLTKLDLSSLDLSALGGAPTSAPSSAPSAPLDTSKLSASTPTQSTSDLAANLDLNLISGGRKGDDGPDPFGLPPLRDEDHRVIKEVVERTAKLATIKNKKRPEQGAVYVVLKANNHDLLHESARTGLWAVSSDTEEVLNKAYDENNCVVLIFSVRDTGHYIGYGFMATQILPRDEQPSAMQADFETLPASWKNPFRVSWARIGSVSFKDHADLTNPFDGGRPVIHALDGQVIPEAAGREICNHIDAVAHRIAKKVGVSRYARMKKEKHIDVIDMCYEEYMLTILTRRKQRLRAARRMCREDEPSKRRRIEPSAPLIPQPKIEDILGSSDAQAQLLKLLGSDSSGSTLNSLIELLGKQ